MSFSFSIITPCYKGKDFLSRAFLSLNRQQGNYAFEWIIVDDFSNDGNKTRDVILRLVSESPFPIVPIFLEQNYYASRSVYTGSKKARGEYTVILDQDDMLSDDALDIFASEISRYEGVAGFAGVCGRCVDMDGQLIGTLPQWSKKLTNELHVRHIDKIRGEMFQCTKTSIISEYFQGMQPGYTNGWAWTQIARNYQYLYTNKVVRIYDTGNPNSTTNTKRMVHLDAQFETLTHYLVTNADYLQNDYWASLKYLVQWCRIGIHLKKNRMQLFSCISKKYHGLLTLIYPLARLKAFQDKRSGRI